MKKNTLLIILGLVIFAFTMFAIARPSSNNTQTASLNTENSGKEVTDGSFFDFGSISMRAGKVSNSFQLKNESSEPLELSKAYTSCMCTTAFLSVNGKRVGPFGMPGHGFGGSTAVSETIAPGSEAVLEVIFDPAAHGPAGIGRADRTVFVETKTGEVREFRFVATVTP